MNAFEPIPLKIRVLGCGTSVGVPVIGCQCPVCQSGDPKNNRLRSSVAIEALGKYLLIDCGIDFRQQMLRAPLPRIDALMLTHAHADHVSGLDDLRVYNFMQQGAIPFFTTQAFIDDIRVRFSYAFNPLQTGGGVPRLELTAVTPGEPFLAAGIPVTAIEIMHGILPIVGFRIGNFAYLTDCSAIPESSLPLLEGLDTLFLSALRHRPHATHFTLEQALAAAEAIKPRRVFFTHCTDELDYYETNKTLPPWARMAHDGLELEIESPGS